MDKICQGCGQGFTPWPVSRKFCEACRPRPTYELRTCPHCGQEFTPRTGQQRQCADCQAKGEYEPRDPREPRHAAPDDRPRCQECKQPYTPRKQKKFCCARCNAKWQQRVHRVRSGQQHFFRGTDAAWIAGVSRQAIDYALDMGTLTEVLIPAGRAVAVDARWRAYLARQRAKAAAKGA